MILVEQRDDKLVVLCKQDAAEVPVEMALLGPDEAERLANVILRAVPTLRQATNETQKKTLTDRLTALTAECAQVKASLLAAHRATVTGEMK